MIHNIAPELIEHAVDIETLYELPGNPNLGDDEAVARSLEKFGQRKTFQARVHPDHGYIVVIDGNTGLRAARRLGWTHVAVTLNDDLPWPEALAYALAANHTSELADTDQEALEAMMLEVADEDEKLLEAAGYTSDEIDALLREVDDEDPEELLAEADGDEEVELEDDLDEERVWPVVVECQTERDQLELTKELAGRGFRVRA